MSTKKKVIVVGGGPAGMFAAWYLGEYCEVHLFEQSSSPGRKLLVAGRGGLNITSHSIQKIRKAYTPSGFMNRALDLFNNDQLRKWLSDIGVPTFVGSSGKVFPQKGMKAVEVVKKMTDALYTRNVTIHLNHRLIGFTPDNIFTFELTGKGRASDTDSSTAAVSNTISHTADYCVLALGGASWPQTGSDGQWVNMFYKNGICTKPFLPSNCGINIDWPGNIRLFHAGKPLKNIRISAVNPLNRSLAGEEKHKIASYQSYVTDDIKLSPGEALITAYGLEGAAIYNVVPELRTCFTTGTDAFISIDFKPLNSLDQLIKRVRNSNYKQPIRSENQSTQVPDYKALLSLHSEEMALIKSFTEKYTFTDVELFCSAVKNLVIPVKSLRPVDEAISVTGGVSLDAINENMSLKSNPGIFVAGEMVDWDAPTGGFLLQGCFSMAALAAHSIINFKG